VKILKRKNEMTQEEIEKIIIAGLRAEKSLNEIHKELQTEHNVKMTFMELRLMSADLDIDWDSLEPEPEVVEEDPAEAAAKAQMLEDQASSVQIEVSKISRPDAALSGTVSFPSGLSGEWTLDHYGQLGMDLGDPEARPSEEEMMEFQNTLRAQLGG